MIDNAGPNTAIGRQNDRSTVVVGATADAAGALNVRNTAGLQMLVPAGAASQNVAVYVSDQIDGDYVPLNNSSGPVAFDVVASNAYDLDEALFTCHYVKFIGDGDPFTATILAKG